MAWKHIWLLAPNGDDGLCGQPFDIHYFHPTTAEQVWPSHGDTDDASILTDGSETRTDFETIYIGGGPDFVAQVNLDINEVPTGTIDPPATAELSIHYRADRDHRFLIREGATGVVAARADATIGTVSSDASPLGGGWRMARVTYEPGWNATNIVTVFESTPSDVWRLEIYPAFAPSSYDATVWSWVSEVAVGFMSQSLESPPCRLFPRADGLGVGGGRHFPPSKSQQRSGRRFGYY